MPSQRFPPLASRRTRGWLAGLLALILALGVILLPPLRGRLAWRWEALRTSLVYWLNPPEQALFQPTEQALIATVVAQTMQAYQTQAASTPAATIPAASNPIATPTATPIPLPDFVQLDGVKYEHQHGRYNYCGPANFSMALTFWGWEGNRDVIGQALMPGNNLDSQGKPGDNDVNVMPYELQDYIRENIPSLSSVLRYGGEIDLLRRLVAAGFPVLVEKGIYEIDRNGKRSWMGHYAFVTGYDHPNRQIIYQDTYQPSGAPAGHNRRISYDEFLEGWRAFNYLFIVVYPRVDETQVFSLLGDWADETWAARHALEIAQAESLTLSGNDQFFAWFNRGTSHVALFEYADAAIAYDYAFTLYAGLSQDNRVRPYRMMWYQTGPYKAYFWTGRYLDVIRLATTTLEETISKPILEESLYWRGQAYYMIGDTQAAINDYRAALRYHPNWGPALQALRDLGVHP